MRALNKSMLIILSALFALTGAACNGPDDNADPTTPPLPTSAAPTAPSTPDHHAMYLAALSTIDPGLAADREGAIQRAEETCADIAAGEITGDALAERVAERLSGGNATIDADQAQAAIELMEQHVCHR